jgi:hypothetical protein
MEQEGLLGLSLLKDWIVDDCRGAGCRLVIVDMMCSPRDTRFRL